MSSPDPEQSSGSRESKTIPKDNSEYKKREYWDERFKEEDSFEWLGKYAEFRDIIRANIPTSARLLIVGCGNSNLSNDMYDDGYANITNIDFSATVIAHNRERSAHRTGMKWLVMDMLDLQFPDSYFDIVLDKCAMDALLVDEGDPWHPSPACVAAVHTLCVGVQRVLVPQGRYLVISFGQPHFRKPHYFNKYPWRVEHEVWGG
jgi:SAM-dependent methyltransferase